ncbi:LEAF RUST 10 DISEASE-RESISTANCE LOCUS RECEPTOR-LIKE PROTEIN KINASE-like 2.4 isoform X1 [Quercus robur]|uniref:LEAF RUST 10 DISEASE-RESISTANCE LOCUS RECEPTOR-LIKE PROTEIN KINASE-like 2.4 isoform X1 n=1 Tax=Quercus robur TaxID=38942 RepID=UPI002161C763|nr:LEAF RUST 10 DISEASE-RESISTANCE LOCUS RECEPTOR-LIKE PROTEIN KINASE-like 2.4 isoform X1 [Quercus robur]
MARGLTFTAGVLAALIAVVLVQETCSDTAEVNDHHCPPSSCGNIHNISYPFRLKSDPDICGDSRYELSCENNRTTVLYLFARKYHVQEINYNNYTIRVVDSGIWKDNYFSFPSYSLNSYNFSQDRSAYTTYLPKRTEDQDTKLSRSVVLMSCEKPVNSLFYLDASTCNIDSGKDFKKRYKYVKVGRTNARDVEDSCKVEQMFLTSWPGNDDPVNTSCTDVHNELLYGFELSWLQVICEHCSQTFILNNCYLDDANLVHCGGRLISTIRWLFEVYLPQLGAIIIGLHFAAKILLGSPCVIAFFIYKWRRRHLSMCDAVENFLQSHNNLMPIRYSYSQTKKMTKSFKDKLGEGGYGSVYKGKLQSGHLVAIKMLSNKSNANGQEFINEVATIGRIHHENVVQLIGYCVEGLKRALIYEFMPNSSLDKFIFSQEGNISLSIEKTYNISLGVARGIEYLHRGCDMQILHLDIKPHNILLDENFTPKVSDFGLAKLYPTDDSIVSLTTARGTLGYIAPELFYKNIGGVSYKADVYSFGMLLLETASKRKNLNAFVEHSSQIYFPTWVYGQFNEGNGIEMEDATKEEKKTIKKMIIVALWCIQMKPSDRPSMNKVVEMLEGEVECLQMPSKPFLLSSPKRPIGDVEDNLNSTSSSIQ